MWPEAESPDARVTHAVSMVTVGLQLHDDRTLENKTGKEFNMSADVKSGLLQKLQLLGVREGNFPSSYLVPHH